MTKGAVKWLENRILRRGFTVIWSYPKHARQMGDRRRWFHTMFSNKLFLMG